MRIPFLKLELPFSGGTLQVSWIGVDPPAGEGAGYLLGEEVEQLSFGHGCGGVVNLHHVLNTRHRPIKSILHCRSCGKRVELPPMHRVIDLAHWAYRNKCEPMVFNLPITQGWQKFADKIQAQL